MKDVIINIKGSQGIDNDDNTIELTTYGKMSYKDGKFLISYEETETLGSSLVKTLVKADGNDRITMLRSGGIESRIVIEKGRRNKCFYSVSEGDIVLGIFGENITNTLRSDGGIITMDYTIDIDNGLISKNRVEISVKEVKNNVTNS